MLPTGGSVPKGLESHTKERKVIKITDIARKENSMTDKEKLEKIKKLADAMYYAAFNLTTDASLLRKAMDEYHQFIIYKYYKKEPVSEELEEEIEKYMDALYHNWTEDERSKDSDVEELCKQTARYFTNWQKQKDSIVSEELEEAAKRYATEGDEISGLYIIDEEVEAFKAGAKWQKSLT